MSEQDLPLAIYLPGALDEAQRREWRDVVVADLMEAGAVDQEGVSSWSQLLDTAAADEFPEGASGAALLVSTQLPPTYLWITMGQPSGNPTGLGDAVLDTQLAGEAGPPPGLAAQGEVYQRTRAGWVEQPDSEPVLVQTSVTATTLDVPGLGPTDVCLWFNSIDPPAADDLQPAIAELAVAEDLLIYLST